MELYFWVKLIHIISATLLFGTGIGTAFFMLNAYLSNNIIAMRVTTRTVVLADWIFTTPAIVVQLVSGLWLTSKLGISFGSAWFVTVFALYLFVGACWIPVVFIQLRIRDIICRGGGQNDYQSLIKIWIALGILAFISVLALFYLMVSKVGMSIDLFG